MLTERALTVKLYPVILIVIKLPWLENYDISVMTHGT